MVKRHTAPKSRWYTTLRCIVNHSTSRGFFCNFSDINILQGSVATCLKYGRKFAANLLVSLPMKEF